MLADTGPRIYVAAENAFYYFDKETSTTALLSRRDVRTQSEQLKLVIDSYHDKKTAFQFITNPAGVKRDFYVSNDNNEDDSWDGLWTSAGRITDAGYRREEFSPAPLSFCAPCSASDRRTGADVRVHGRCTASTRAKANSQMRGRGVVRSRH